jgi:hypothetical protein
MPRIIPTETVETNDGLPKNTRWWDRPDGELGRVLTWNVGANSALVELIHSDRISGPEAYPTGTITVIDSATVAAGAAHVFDGTPSGGGDRDTRRGLFVRYAPSSAGQQTSLRFVPAEG